MDVAYNQHAPHSRRNRSSTSLNHLTLAPLTSRLPLSDPDELPHHVSYIEGKSAPTTPSVLSHSSSRLNVKKLNSGLLKSKSSTQLVATPTKHHHRSGTTTPGSTKSRRALTREELSISSLSAKDRNDSDWLLRAGATISSSTRESKGQAWLVSRASSTSLSGQLDDDEQTLQQELAREREQTSRRESRRGSMAGAFDADDEFSPITTRRSFSFGPGSRTISRYGSRATSRRGSRAQLFTPAEGGNNEGYFYSRHSDQDGLTEPDFVDAEDEEEDLEEGENDDEAIVRKLARASSLGLTGWLEHLLGWSLFPVDEDGEETETDEKSEGSEVFSKVSRKAFGGAVGVTGSGPMPPLKTEEAGAWDDAAWLLSVATKVIF